MSRREHSTESLIGILKTCDTHIRFEFLKVVNVKVPIFLCLEIKW